VSAYEIVLTCKVRCPGTLAGQSTDFIVIPVEAVNRPEAVAKVTRAIRDVLDQMDAMAPKPAPRTGTW